MDINDLVSQEVQRVLAEQQQKDSSKDGATGAATPQPIRVNLGGQVVEYASADALSAALDQTFAHVGQRTAAMEQELAQLRQSQNQGSYATGTEKPEDSFDVKQFVEAMQEDPRKGFGYLLNQTVFDGQAQDPFAEFKQMRQENETLKRTLAAEQFKTIHPEYPGGPQVAQTVESVRQQLGLPYTAQGLDAAYTMAIKQGHIPNFPGMYAEAQQIKAQMANPNYNPADPNTPFDASQVPADSRQHLNGGQPIVAPYRPNPWAGVQNSAAQWNGGGAGHGINPNPQFAQNPYLQGVPQVRRGGQAPAGNVDYDNLSAEQIEQILTKFQR